MMENWILGQPHNRLTCNNFGQTETIPLARGILQQPTDFPPTLMSLDE